MEEYFTEIDKIPRRSNMKLFNDILQSFLDSKLKIVKVNSKVFSNRNMRYLGNALGRYVKLHNIPIKIHYVSEVIYLERIWLELCTVLLRRE